ncbi:flagellin N-terminal helical domain-containing protein [Marinimicrobium alkaliphilum]|uniref:flagellin N-terminal helical domain-containing protein n=1 Tax=Marinimicrobium alkaliphilum TaxID=2202654 RepID=UPI000DB90AD2|nr:flagellin [Marinimicrobium alkaliphilum]
MSLVINTNVASLNAQRQLMQSGNALDQATERLSSGNRINSAKDDAAGLAISNRMTSQIRGLDQAIRNANDGISMIQTAEGALQEATNILQRMRELSIQSANGIYSNDDRQRLDSEVQQLKVELDRLANDTTFNGQKLLDGSLSNALLQVGSEQGQTIGVSVESFNTRSLGGTTGDLVGEESTGIAALNAFAGGAGTTLVINDVNISDLSGAGSVNDAMKIINADLKDTGIEASTIVQATASGVGDGVLRGTDTFDIVVTDGDDNTQSYQIGGTNSMEELVAKINADTSIEASLDNRGRLVLSAEGVETIAVTDASDATGFGTAAVTTQFSLVLNDTTGQGRAITVENDAGTAAGFADLGIDRNDSNGNLVGVAVGGAAGTLNEGDLLINGVAVGETTLTTTVGDNAEALAKSINDISSQTGVVANVSAANELLLRSATGDQISIKFAENATNVGTQTGLQERNALDGIGSVASLDISTFNGAQKAIGILDNAIDQVGQARADLGAINNRLDFTVSNLANISEKTSAARSRITDADFAAETAELSRSQVLQQAASAMLAQANARPQQVLQLLQ